MYLLPNPVLPDEYVEARWLKISPDEANLAPYGEEFSEGPFEVRRRSLIDGSHGTRTKDAAVIRFPQPATLTEVRLSIPQADFAIADGDVRPAVSDLAFLLGIDIFNLPYPTFSATAISGARRAGNG